MRKLVLIKTMILIAVFPKDIILSQIIILIDVLSKAIPFKAVSSKAAKVIANLYKTMILIAV